ncbi:MAG: DUF1290 domain-containing protein [Tissierellia bacterium]|jgi:small basic protein|nr:DUF1290 domain-containing protein [Tissierellia bacterium]
MIYVAAGLILGIVAGLNLNLVYNSNYIVYISLTILAILNTIINLLHDNKTSELTIAKSLAFLLTDLLFALLLGFVGEQLGLPIYLAAVFAFGNNIYKKLRNLVDIYLEKFDKNK